MPKAKTTYIPSIEILEANVAEAYNYRRNKETLGVLYYTINNNKWNVLDFMNNITNTFDAEKQAKIFIKNCTPIFI